MAKQVRRFPVKQTKNGTESLELLATISSFKAELSKIKKEIKEENKTLKDVTRITEQKAYECNDIFEKLSDAEAQYEAENQRVLDMIEKQEKLDAAIDNKTGELLGVIKELATAKKNRDSFIRTSENNKQEVIAAMQAAANEFRLDIEEEISSKQMEAITLEEKVIALAKEKTAKEGELNKLEDRKGQLLYEIEMLEETLEVAIAVKTKKIKAAELDALGAYKYAQEMLKEESARLEELTAVIAKARKEAVVALDEAAEAKDRLTILTLEQEKSKDKYSKELEHLRKQHAIAQKDLNEVRSQKFSIIKGKKDLGLLYNHIKGLYDDAGITMPKIDIKE